jgi:hypothetical protein
LGFFFGGAAANKGKKKGGGAVDKEAATSTTTTTTTQQGAGRGKKRKAADKDGGKDKDGGAKANNKAPEAADGTAAEGEPDAKRHKPEDAPAEKFKVPTLSPCVRCVRACIAVCVCGEVMRVVVCVLRVRVCDQTLNGGGCANATV